MNAAQIRDKTREVAESPILKLLAWGSMTILSPLVVAACIGLWHMSTQVATLTQKIDNIGTPYTVTDAAKDFRARDQKDADQDRRIQENRQAITENRGRIRALEDHP